MNRTIFYFDKIYNKGQRKQLIIIDDINWSSGMREAWKKIKSLMKASISIDIFKIGIILVDPEIDQVQHFSYIPWKYKPWKLGLFAPN